MRVGCIYSQNCQIIIVWNIKITLLTEKLFNIFTMKMSIEFTWFFPVFINFIIIDQNICFFLFYVNLVFHILFWWIMWITLCITQFSSKINLLWMWITFAPKSTLSTFFDKFCAICQMGDFVRFSSTKLLSHIFLLL